MNKIIISLVVAAVLIGGYFLFRGSYPTPSVPQTSNQQTAPQSPTSEPSTQQPINQPSATVELSQPSSMSQAPIVTAKTYSVSIQNFAFSQKSINIKKGDTVVWTNKDSAPHTVTGVNDGPASGTLNNSSSYSFTFNSAGTFSYKCAFHPSMTGSVVVTQ